ncbi:hypothetical protein [Pectobacterium brasiliense]|uniref:hypothetical protein n=1 Tax=Pectobacterium brasiliense TaxID=180957 RepID=UPI0019693E53|nr:hypothetical protein [Pectobacterium brasiliense]MBN3265298.1 hypothetical protein [Pectobacterium brasiliense]
MDEKNYGTLGCRPLSADRDNLLGITKMQTNSYLFFSRKYYALEFLDNEFFGKKDYLIV